MRVCNVTRKGGEINKCKYLTWWWHQKIKDCSDTLWKGSLGIDGYYVAYKPITLSYILFMFIEMKFIHCHSCVMFAMKSMSMCND